MYDGCRCRRGEQAQESIIERVSGAGKVELLIGDCGLQADVRRVMEEFSGRESRLDGLVCNAGACAPSYVRLRRRQLARAAEPYTASSHIVLRACVPTDCCEGSFG